MVCSFIVLRFSQIELIDGSQCEYFFKGLEQLLNKLWLRKDNSLFYSLLQNIFEPPPLIVEQLDVEIQTYCILEVVTWVVYPTQIIIWSNHLVIIGC